MSTTEHDLDTSKLDDLDTSKLDDLDDDLDLDAVTEVDVTDDVDTVDDDVDTVDDDVDTVDDAGDAATESVEVDTSVDDRLESFDDFLAETQVEELDESEPYELPEILLATELDEELGAEVNDELTVDDRTVTNPDELEVVEAPISDDVLEELRRADIDGPTVAFAPQDDTSSAKRRPTRSPDYDPAPMPIPLNVPRILGRKPRVRRVTRVVRHVDPWSVFKIAIIAMMLVYVIVLVAGVLLWNVANATGTVDNVERFFESFGWASFEFNGGEIYHSAWTGGIFLVIGFTGLAVLAATMFNLITDLVGGVRFTVLEEEVVESRTSPMRRFVVRRPEPEIPLVTHDASGAISREGVVDDTAGYRRR